MRLLAFLFSQLVVLAAHAETAPVYTSAGAELGLVKYSTVSISDNVSDNCWTNSSTVKSELKLSLEQNAISALTYQPAFYGPSVVSTALSAFGYRTASGVCAVAAEFSVATRVYPSLGQEEWGGEYVFGYSAEIAKQSSIFTNSANVNEQISDFARGATAEFLSQVLAARRMEDVVGFHSVYPDFWVSPISAEEWKKRRADGN